MHRRVINLCVGLLFLFGIVAFIVLAFKVSGLSDFYTSHNGYTVTAEFANIGGLKPRARIAIAGVSVGRVIAIDFNKNDYVAQVKMFFDNSINNIPEDSRASILTSGLLGDNYVGLTPGFSDDFLKEGSRIPLENTSEAIVLESLLSKFFSSQASGLKNDEIREQ